LSEHNQKSKKRERRGTGCCAPVPLHRLAEVFDLPSSSIPPSAPDFDEAYGKPYHVLFDKVEWCKKHFARRCDASRFARRRAAEVYNWYTI